MRALAFGAAMSALVLAACSGQKTASFTCPNGPNIVVAYADDSATIYYDNNRTEVLPRSETLKDVYVKPGLIWAASEFRSGRLTDGQSSYHCDQTSN